MLITYLKLAPYLRKGIAVVLLPIYLSRYGVDSDKFAFTCILSFPM